MPLDSIEINLPGLVTELKTKTDEVKKFADYVQKEMKNLGTATAETKAGADKALAEMHTLNARVGEVEQKMARRGGPSYEPETRKSIGQHVIDNPEVKDRLLAGPMKGSVSFSIETKTLTSATSTWGTTADTSTSLVAADRQPGILGLPMRPLTVRDLVAPGSTISNSIEYAIQTTRTNNAAVVAEGALKPSSNYVWDLRAFPVRTIAHLVKASRQILDDAPGLQSTVDAEMRYGIAYAEEAELLYGDGTGAHLTGIVPQATSYAAPFTFGAGETAIDRLRLAMLQAAQSLYPVSGVVLNPLDWTKIETIKDSMGRYIIGDPQGTAVPKLWGVPVVASLALTAGTFVAGSFNMGAQIFDRMSIEVLISTENNDDFEKNMVSIRAEERLAFVVKRPAAFIAGSLP